MSSYPTTLKSARLTADIAAAYARLQSCAKVGRQFGMATESIRNRLIAGGVKLRQGYGGTARRGKWEGVE